MLAGNTIPPPLRDLLKKIEFFSMIQKGQKPCICDMTFVKANSLYGWYKRVCNSEGKKSMILTIEQIIDDTITALRDKNNGLYHTLLFDGLTRLREGLINLTDTYKNHPMTVSSLRVCINNIDLQIVK
jgi:hypothetical protein